MNGYSVMRTAQDYPCASDSKKNKSSVWNTLLFNGMLQIIATNIANTAIIEIVTNLNRRVIIGNIEVNFNILIVEINSIISSVFTQ